MGNFNKDYTRIMQETFDMQWAPTQTQMELVYGSLNSIFGLFMTGELRSVLGSARLGE